MTKSSKPYLVNPDSASKMIHYLPMTDGRCKIDKIENPLKYRSLGEIDRKLYPNKCSWCMK